MQRLYHKSEIGPWKGMQIQPHLRKDSEVLYAINRVPREGWRRRRGYDRFFNSQSTETSNFNGYNHISASPVTGLYDYRFPETDGESHWLIVGNNRLTANGDYGGNVFLWHMTSLGPLAQNLSTLAGISLAADANSRYDFRVLNGMLYGINGGKCDLFKIDYRALSEGRTVMSLVVPSYEIYTSGATTDTNVYFEALPKASVLGSFQGRLLLANLDSAAVATRQKNGSGVVVNSTVSFADSSPRTVIMSEAITWLYPNVGWQTEEFFTFETGDEQEITAQREFAGRNVFFLTDSVWILNGNRAATGYSSTNVSNGVGCIAPQSIQEVDAGLIFLSSEGFCLLDRSFTVKNISGNIAPLFMEGHGTYDAPALQVYQDGMKTACSVAYHGANEYRCWLPMQMFADKGGQLCFVYNFERDGWTIAGIAAPIGADPASGDDNFTTKEKGMPATSACMYEDQPGRELPIWGDHEGWVNVEAPHNMDAYWITRIVRSDIGRTFFNIRDLMSSRVDELKGAMIVMIDDRTLTEQQDGTFTDTGRNPPGTVRTIASNTDNYGSAYSRVGLSVAWPVVPQEGAVVALFWPIRDRLITEIYTQNPETYKRLSRLQARVKARNDGHLKIRVTGQPEALNSDDILNDLPFDVSASLAQAGDVYGATISRFQSANQREIDFWIHAPHDQGRKFYVMFEEFSIEDSEIYGWVTEMQSLGYR